MSVSFLQSITARTTIGMADRSDRDLNRREFLTRGALGAAGAAMAFGGLATPAAQAAPKRIMKDGMAYRRLGRTELMVSEISLGGSPSPPPAVFAAALDRGINLADTSAAYGAGEEQLGEMLKGRRDGFILCTKFHPHRFEDAEAKQRSIAAVEKALGRLQTDRIDIMCVHGAGAPEHCLKEGVVEAFAQLKEEGKIRFTGLSNHRDAANVLPPIIESGHYDVVLLALSAFMGRRRREGDEKPEPPSVHDNWLQESGAQVALESAQQHDVGIVAMKAMAGGARQNLEAYQTGETTLPQAKLKWVLSQETVSSALSELRNFDILEENLAVVGTTLSTDDEAMLRDHVRERSAHVCRMCGSCQRACPQRLPIPDVMRYVMYHDEHGKKQRARRSYRRVSAALVASCVSCDGCVVTCPHGLDIPARLRYAHSILA